MSEHELPKRGIERVTVDTVTRREDKVRRRAIPNREYSDAVHDLHVFVEEDPHRIAGSNHFSTRPQDVCNCALRIRSLKDELSASCVWSASKKILTT